MSQRTVNDVEVEVLLVLAPSVFIPLVTQEGILKD